jgi:hypothetical protein
MLALPATATAAGCPASLAPRVYAAAGCPCMLALLATTVAGFHESLHYALLLLSAHKDTFILVYRL